jgi:hypothetical protein
MGWDVGYVGNCSACGEHLHQVAEDRQGMRSIWLRCPMCLKSEALTLPDAEAGRSLDEPRRCTICATPQEPWAASRCPRCGQEDAAEFIYMPD